MSRHPRAPIGASLLALAVASAPAAAQSRPDPQRPEVIVTAPRPVAPPAADTPASHAGTDAATIATTINATTAEDTLKYLPSLIVRKRNVGDTQAPLATRTAGLGASARSLIYADGALLSALIGNNNGIASPRWSLVSTQEIARVDVLYGPFAAAYPGNSIGAVVNITTRLPDRLEATVSAGMDVERFRQYATDRTLPARQIGATFGDRLGPLAVFASLDHVTSTSQPLTYVTALQPASTSAAGTVVTGAFADRNRLGQPIQVLGANGIEHQDQTRAKLKAALDLGGATRLTYVGALFRNGVDATAESYLHDAATGTPVYAGTLNIAGRSYTVAPGAFSGNVYRYDERHWSHALTLAGTGGRLDWQVIGTLYDFAHDVQRIPTTALPAAASGGAGTITRLDGTGWRTGDATLTWRADVAHTLSAGAHYDRFVLASDRYATTDWRSGDAGALLLRASGRTRTAALWAQDVWRVVPDVTMTAGARYEWWRAYNGVNYLPPAIDRRQPVRTAGHVSPKATLAWSPSAWTVRLSFGEAWRFPTVGELYQVVTSPVAAVPNPDLKPERALSEEFAVEHRDSGGSLRVALFNESIKDALISQTGALNGTATLATFVQNVDRTRARGMEAAVVRSGVLPGFDLSGSVTYADATTRQDSAFPAAVGGLIPGVPRWKATLVGTWHPSDAVALTAAGRYASRLYGTLDNSDVVGNTYGGFYKYLVVDLRAQVKAGRHYTLGLGVDNVGNDRYFLFHPFPQRTFRADVTWAL